MESFLGNLVGGIKFQVHPRNMPPYIESFGMSVGAAMQASIDIKKVIVSRVYMCLKTCPIAVKNHTRR